MSVGKRKVASQGMASRGQASPAAPGLWREESAVVDRACGLINEGIDLRRTRLQDFGGAEPYSLIRMYFRVHTQIPIERIAPGAQDLLMVRHGRFVGRAM